MVTATETPVFTLMPGAQWDFVMSDARHDGLFAGRSAGKTIASVVKAIKYVTEHPGAYGLMTEPIFPKIRQILLPAFRRVAGHLEGLKEGAGWEYKRGDMEIHFPYLKSVIFLRPAEEEESGKGLTLAFFAMDEVAEGHQHETFMNLQPSLRQEGYPHQGWVTSTPHWRKAWLKQRWVDHINPTTNEALDASSYRLFKLQTEKNPHLTPEELAHWRNSFGNTRLAAQELGGEFITVEGAAFPQFSERIHVMYPPPDLKWKRRGIVGHDPGAVSPTASLELGLDENNRVWALQEYYVRNSDEQEWANTMGEWNPKRILVDPNGMSEQEIRQMAQRYGLPCKPARTNKFKTRFQMMSSRLAVRADGHPGTYFTPACPNLIAEVQNLAFAKPRGQDVLIDKWEQGLDDHAFDGYSYGLQEFDHGGMGIIPHVNVGIPWRVR